ncbi:MAG: hypothetical protein MUE44_16280 [Oscillatoriaceae cyanobacterium Prado104]|nr:hypothetical protein [Oscillatoriaceae cyanobacterium Prado104]
MPLKNRSGQVLGYYQYVLVTQPPPSGSGGKLFWLMVIGERCGSGSFVDFR